MTPLTTAEQELAARPELNDICKSVARGFTRTYKHLGDCYDQFMSAGHEALMQVARNFDPSKGDLKYMLRESCRQRCTEVSRKLKRQVKTVAVGEAAVATVPNTHVDKVDGAMDLGVLLTHATPKQRRVVELKLKGLSFTDIGVALGVKRQAVTDMYSRFILTARSVIC